MFAGSVGRIHIEYCATISGSTNPPADTQKLNCYVVEQIDSTPYDRVRLNLPASGTNTYQVQYGRKLNWSGAANQVTSLRVPAGLFTAVTLQALVSDLPSNASFALDIGNSGSNSWSGTVGNGGEYTSPNLAAYFNAYWASHGSPTSGTLDVPVRVYLDRAGQVLLTNLQVTPTGSKVRAIRLPVRPQGYSSVAVSFTVSGGAGPLAVGVDVGDNGSVDWTYTGSPSYPASLTTGNLAAAVNAYLAGKPDPTDVPIRFTLSPFATLNLTGFTATPVGGADASIAAGDVTFGGAVAIAALSSDPVEGDTITISAAIHNPGSLDSGPLTASFFATAPGQREWYIGSTFAANVPANGSVPTTLDWDTLGFSGEVTVRVVVDPFDRVQEMVETNNEASKPITILTRPDLHISAMTLSDPEPLAGQVVTVSLTLRNQGQTAAITSRLALYAGHPDQGGVSICQINQAVPAQSSRSRTCAWTPATPGPYRLYAVSDRLGVVNEYDESNNLSWLDFYVGLATPVELNSGNAPTDPAYDPARGYGVVDTGPVDVVGSCGAAPYQTWRRDDDGRVNYRFGHLQPGHFYHLDLVLYDCNPGAGRVEYVTVNGFELTGPIDLGDGQIHKLSLLLDPALYASRSIQVSVEEREGNGALVSEIALHDVDYRYADAGGPRDPNYQDQTGSQAYGWLDGTATNVWGSLPFQTARRDLNDADVSYRFDGLDPAKRYQVHLSFYQGSGNNRVQQFWIDDQQVGQELTVASGQHYNTTLIVPTATYLGDGSMVVTVRRTNAAEGAMVNEIALEELTQAAPVTCQVTETPRWTTAFGIVTILGQPAPAGTVISAENLTGEVVGCFVVGKAGEYGFMNIYGALGSDPGMSNDEIVTFRVNGALAVATPLLTWQDDKTPHRVDLVAGTIQAQSVLLKPGWNLFSFYTEPPVPALAAVLHSVVGKYCQVLAERGIYDCTVPAPYQSLKEVHAGQAIYLRLEGAASANLVVEGAPVPVDTAIPLHPGWNWVGYLPRTSQPVATALQSIAGRFLLITDGVRLYDPANPGYSTLTQMNPGAGYLIYMAEAATLVYPSGVTAAAEQAGNAICEEAQATPNFIFLFGELLVDGQPAPAGTRLEALTPQGELAGCFVVQEPGQYGFMPLFGRDQTEPVIPGFQAGEPLRILVDGVAVTGVEWPAWSGDRQPQRVDLAVDGVQRLYLPTLQR